MTSPQAAGDVAELREKLDQARAALRDADRTVRMLGHAAADPETPPGFAARLDVEVRVAEKRHELWRDVVAKLETQLRAYGLQP